MHPWGMCTFQYSLHLRADTGQEEGKPRVTSCIEMSHRVSAVLFQTAQPPWVFLSAKHMKMVLFIY